MKTIDAHKPIDVPAEVATCPICGAALSVQCESWEQDDDGTWYANDTDLECVTEPDIDGEEWDGWFAQHWQNMPYVHWLPVRDKVAKWLKENFRFALTEQPQ